MQNLSKGEQMDNFLKTINELKETYKLDRIELDFDTQVNYSDIVVQITYVTKKYHIWFDGLGGFDFDKMLEDLIKFIEESIQDAKESGYNKDE